MGVIPWNTGTVINNGVWNFVAVSWNGQNAVAYVNGAQVATTAFSGTLTMSLTPAGSIGGLFGLYGLNSEISNVKIYNASLPASDIQTLYMEGIGGALGRHELPLRLVASEWQHQRLFGKQQQRGAHQCNILKLMDLLVHTALIPSISGIYI